MKAMLNAMSVTGWYPSSKTALVYIITYKMVQKDICVRYLEDAAD